MCLSTQNILLGFTRRLTKSEKRPLTESENFNSQPHKEADSNFKQITFFLQQSSHVQDIALSGSDSLCFP